jgi:predicted ribosome quality control (RQC) complex YloA/Tae2 family protein
MPDFPQPIEPSALPAAVMDYSTLSVLGRVAREELEHARLRRVIGIPGRELILAFDRPHVGSPASDFSAWVFSADPVLFRFHPWLDELPEKSAHSHFVDVASHHLGGAAVTSVEVLPFERVLVIGFIRRDYSGEESGYRFIAELMGKYSNLVLVDNSDTILASWKPVHSYQSRIREIRAGKKYVPPPEQDKITPREFSVDEWGDFISSADPEASLESHLMHTFKGMSPTWAHSIAELAEFPPDLAVGDIPAGKRSLLREAFIETLSLVIDGVPLTGESHDDFVRRIAADFALRAENAAVDKARSEIRKVVDKRRKKLESLASALEKDIDQADKADEYRKRADLLLANLHFVVPGMTEIEVQDWESEGGTVRLPLEPHLSPQLQVETWYQKYRKLKRAKDIAAERLRTVRAEEEELDPISENLAAAESIDDVDLVRVQAELHGLILPAAVETGASAKSRREKRRRGEGTRPGERVQFASHRYRSNDGFLILAGTGDRSNDALRRMSRPDDIWLHVRDIPGAHVYVVTRGMAVPESTIREAAMIAAWHSKARQGSNVPVDYTRAKYLTPIPGAGPGHVRFRRERTIRVTPDERRVKMMALMAGGEGV